MQTPIKTPPLQSQQTFITKEELRGAVKNEMKRERRSAFFRKVVTYVISFFVFVFLILLLIGYVTAKLGVSDVPFFTKNFYKPVTATRTVYPLVGANAQQVLTGVIARGVFAPASQSMSIYFSEQELTTVFNGALEQQEGLKNVQVVITKDFIEVYGSFVNNEREIPMLLVLQPSVVEGELKVDVQKSVIGALNVPRVIVGAAVDAAVRNFTQSMKEALGGGVLKSLMLEEEKLHISFTVPDQN